MKRGKFNTTICKFSEENVQTLQKFLTLNYPNWSADVLPYPKQIMQKKYFPPFMVHRSRMETEAKAKVVVSVYGATFIPFLAALAILSLSIWKNRMDPSVFIQID